MNASERVRVGVVGLGGMGTNHAGNVVDFGHEVVAGTDVVPEIRDAFAAEFDVPTYETYEDMYVREDLDAVIVTTPNKFHEPATVAALECDYDVLCEKPLADDLAGAERIADAAAESEGFCMVGFHNRFSTPMTLFKEQQAAGRFGEITHVEANYVRRRGIPGVGSWFTSKELAGGGALIDIGVHVLDLALHALEFPEIVEVTGVTRSDFGGRTDYADPDGFADHWDGDGETFDVDDSVTAYVRCADGTTISLNVSWAANRATKDDLVVQGTDAGAEFSLHDDALTIFETGTEGGDHYADTELTGSLEPAGHAAEDRRFLEAVLAGEAPDINTVEQGLTVQRVIDAIYRSSEDGEAKRLVPIGGVEDESADDGTDESEPERDAKPSTR
ncbi:Gfo/Idh/MocA family protein [Halomontanus rarus]|uniref:Gfo/Idh/MocA family protein n=1 Tax=Halomontanus rarus TaxID=3034020 RepID=UPI0023E7C005|nr:Gfo/Idh/MocA family oxidoreductase [Halovivax sp. TS33]